MADNKKNKQQDVNLSFTMNLDVVVSVVKLLNIGSKFQKVAQKHPEFMKQVGLSEEGVKKANKFASDLKTQLESFLKDVDAVNLLQDFKGHIVIKETENEQEEKPE